jgi:two-component system NtrC family sensor kinase
MQPKSQKTDLTAVLKNVRIFYHIPSEVIDILAGKMVITDFKADQPVFIKGEIGDYIYVIVTGNVKLHEQDMVIAEMGKGDFFGEFSLLDNEPRSLSVTCTVPSTLAGLHRNDFYLVLKEHPDTIRDIIEALIKRIKDQNNKIFSYLKNAKLELEAEVDKKTKELQENNKELSETLDKLKRTQQQLVMKEMLASLGQLTAGIAHTLKNPLNFINNFSLISFDLMNEIMKSDDEAEKKELLLTLKTNIEKVYNHGKRANSIVENMLQHSTTGAGEKQLLSLNELAEEIVTIANQHYKANNPGFTCEIKKDYAIDLPPVNVSPKEISRVLLNLLNNAFDAVDEKSNQPASNGSYAPLVEVTTCVKNNLVMLAVRDNGNGIPGEIREKIFEPFFTTKPSGHSNGLGLSMSNEIVKLYGGEVRVESEQGKGAQFSILFKPA